MEKLPIALTAELVASATFVAGCGQGSAVGSGPGVDGLASLSVDAVMDETSTDICEEPEIREIDLLAFLPAYEGCPRPWMAPDNKLPW